ncbi:MAG TPA: hypothetical protein VHG53_05330 [Candidatus Limnocylindria bacterium]|nr:hypothetical protein [Candidatus Limnocylindria bacterium]
MAERTFVRQVDRASGLGRDGLERRARAPHRDVRRAPGGERERDRAADAGDHGDTAGERRRSLGSRSGRRSRRAQTGTDLNAGGTE